MKTYKVWIGLEEHDPETDEYVNIDLEFAATYITCSEKQARKFAGILHRLGIQVEVKDDIVNEVREQRSERTETTRKGGK